jgi:hypothetical protein
MNDFLFCKKLNALLFLDSVEEGDGWAGLCICRRYPVSDFGGRFIKSDFGSG